MKIITCYETEDNQLFKTKTKAIEYLDKKFADVIFPLAHGLAGMQYKSIHDFIERNLDKFVELKNIKNDMEKIDNETLDFHTDTNS